MKYLIAIALSVFLVVAIAIAQNQSYSGATTSWRLGSKLTFDNTVKLSDEQGTWSVPASALANIAHVAPSTWTNDSSVGNLYPLPQQPNRVSVQATNDANAGAFLEMTIVNPNNSLAANIAISGEANGDFNILQNGYGAGIAGWADSGANRQYGVLAVGSGQNAGQTNFAIGAFSATSGSVGSTNGGIYIETSDFGADQGTARNLQSAGILVDLWEQDIPAQIWRTNNGTVIAKLDKTGLLTANSYLTSGGIASGGSSNPGPGNIRATNEVYLSSSTLAHTVSGNDGLLWNSNKVLYWVTSTKTNLVSDGR